MSRTPGSRPLPATPRRWRRLLALLLPLGAGCSDPVPMSGDPGQPLPHLGPADSTLFRTGQTLFNRAFTEDEGLGPLFNERQCSGCHDIPTSGGSGAEIVQKATRWDPVARTCDLLTDQGGDNIQQRATTRLAHHGFAREPRPAEATAFEAVVAPSLYGLGLVEAIPEATILSRADPDDANGDGISGRAGRTADGRVARFGRKATDATVAEFVDGAFQAELGLTTPRNPEEGTVGAEALPDGVDPAPDPELTAAEAEAVVAYIRFLVPPRRAEDAVTTDLGERLFQSVGCSDCHVPTMQTAPSGHTTINKETVALYSDLLLHDLGPEMAGICGPTASPSEYRTAPLMGLRFRIDLLHDGRAQSIERAISFHGGEADRARVAYHALTERQRQALLRFLATL